MYTFYISRLFVTFCLIISIESTKVNNCVITPATLPEAVNIVDCDSPPCTFYIGKSGVMAMTFRAPRYLEKFQPQAWATVYGLNVTYPLEQDDGCVGVTNTPCPLAKGELVEYKYAMEILPIFPTASLVLEFSLIDLDQDSEPFMCFKVDLQLSKE